MTEGLNGTSELIGSRHVPRYLRSQTKQGPGSDFRV